MITSLAAMAATGVNVRLTFQVEVSAAVTAPVDVMTRLPVPLVSKVLANVIVEPPAALTTVPPVIVDWVPSFNVRVAVAVLEAPTKTVMVPAFVTLLDIERSEAAVVVLLDIVAVYVIASL